MSICPFQECRETVLIGRFCYKHSCIRCYESCVNDLGCQIHTCKFCEPFYHKVNDKNMRVYADLREKIHITTVEKYNKFAYLEINCVCIENPDPDEIIPCQANDYFYDTSECDGFSLKSHKTFKRMNDFCIGCNNKNKCKHDYCYDMINMEIASDFCKMHEDVITCSVETCKFQFVGPPSNPICMLCVGEYKNCSFCFKAVKVNQYKSYSGCLDCQIEAQCEYRKEKDPVLCLIWWREIGIKRFLKTQELLMKYHRMKDCDEIYETFQDGMIGVLLGTKRARMNILSLWIKSGMKLEIVDKESLIWLIIKISCLPEEIFQLIFYELSS